MKQATQSESTKLEPRAGDIARIESVIIVELPLKKVKRRRTTVIMPVTMTVAKSVSRKDLQLGQKHQVVSAAPPAIYFEHYGKIY